MNKGKRRCYFERVEVKMKDRIRIDRLLVYLCALSAAFFLGQAGPALTAHAAENDFVINAGVRPGSDSEWYEIGLTIQNNGADWEGTARLMIEDGSRKPCAYDTVLSLPEGSVKQFAVRIPVSSMDGTQGTAHVFLLDGGSRLTVEREFERFLQDEADALNMGILSDDYSALTYLDMGGEEIYFHGDDYPVRLESLNQDNLLEKLDSMVILVVDRYSTEVLTDEEMEAIEDWVDDGGVLILGTGAYVEETLGGFDEAYLGIEWTAPHPAGGGASGYSGSDDPSEMNYFVDSGQLTMADLKERSFPYDRNAYSGGLSCSMGYGAVTVLPFALTELGQLNADAFPEGNRTDYVRIMLDEACSNASARYNRSYYDTTYNMNRLFGILGNSNSELNFGVLKVIVIIYVVFVGPVLYLVLKLVRKREFYWIAVPVSALFGIGVIYLAGMGFEVKETKVYSVTVEAIGEKIPFKTYMQCYDAKHSEWQLKLADHYQYAGPVSWNNYYGYKGDLNYYQHVRREGDGLFFGIKPSSSFETCFFQAGGANAEQEQGRVELSGIQYGFQGLSGEVANETEHDFQYFAIITNDIMYIYDGLAAGESRNLTGLEPVYEGDPVYAGYGDYIFQTRRSVEEGRTEEARAQAALGIGICAEGRRAEAAQVFFIGVTGEYEKAVDDLCNEMSYGCFYAVK